MAGLLALGGACSAVAADFLVTTPGFYYSINGAGMNPDITVVRGTTYTFAVNVASVHPFQISSDMSATPYDNGVVNNNITQGTITFAVPTNAPDTLYYVCTIHLFGGTIHVVNPAPPPPPTVRIISLSHSSNSVTLMSTGTNGWQYAMRGRGRESCGNMACYFVRPARTVSSRASTRTPMRAESEGE